MNFQQLREKAFTDHLIFEITMKEVKIYYINFMTTIRDKDVIDDNLDELLTFIKSHPNSIFCLLESRQIIINDIPITKDPVAFLQTNLEDKSVVSYKYNKTKFAMNLILISDLPLKHGLIKLGPKSSLGQNQRRALYFWVNKVPFIFAHAYFPKEQNEADIKIKQLEELNKFVRKNGGVAFGDGNLGVFEYESSVNAVSNGVNLLTRDWKTFFGSTRDEYAVQNIHNFEEMSPLDFVISNRNDIQVSMIKPIN